MAQIVGGFCLPHDPLITGLPNAASADQAASVAAAFSIVRRSIVDLEADTVIVIGDDHCAMFGPGCQPSILIGIGDLEGPLEPWLNIERRRVQNNEPLACHIMNFGYDRGFDWAVAKSLLLDHSVMVPVHLAVPNNVATIPIYVANAAEPLIRPQRCRALGQNIGAAVREWSGNERVVVLGTGGISHWVGMPQMGQINVAFDKKVLQFVEQGDIDALVSLSTEHVMQHGGNGALELRNWVVAMAAVGDFSARVLAYEAVEPWITGLGFVALEVSADRPHSHRPAFVQSEGDPSART